MNTTQPFYPGDIVIIKGADNRRYTITDCYKFSGYYTIWCARFRKTDLKEWVGKYWELLGVSAL